MHQFLLGRTKTVQITALQPNCNNGTQLCSTTFIAERRGHHVFLYSRNCSHLWNGLKRYISYFYQVLQGQWSYNHVPTCFSPLWVVYFFPFNLRRQISLHCYNLASFYTDLATAGDHMEEIFKFLSNCIIYLHKEKCPTVINIFEYFKVMK
jgi:hypothetical protein